MIQLEVVSVNKLPTFIMDVYHLCSITIITVTFINTNHGILAEKWYIHIECY